MPPDRAQIESKLLAALHLADRLARELLTARRRDEAPKDMGPPLAKRTDGALLVNADYLPGSALAGRSLWVGVVLEGSEAEGIRAGMEEASIELVSHLAAKLTTAPESEADGRIDTPPGP